MKEKKENDEAYETYGEEITADDDGFYSITTTDLFNLLARYDIYVQDDAELDKIHKDINRLWKDQKKLITPTSLDEYSKKDNGLQYKHYLLCEEYLKDSNITRLSALLHLSRPTIYEWLKRDDVQKYLQERKEELEEENRRQYKDLYKLCFEELAGHIKGHFAEKDADKIKAIEVYLRHYETMKRLKADTGHADTQVNIVDDVTE